MDTWIELMSEPMRSEMLQLELLCRDVIESLPVILCGIMVVCCAFWLLVALDCMLRERRHLPQSHEACETGQRYDGLSGERFSQTATRFSQDQTSAAA